MNTATLTSQHYLNYKGFTLIELICALAIIGVLATFTGPDVILNAKIAITRNQMKSIGRILNAARFSGDSAKPLREVTGFNTAFLVGEIEIRSQMSLYSPNAEYREIWRKLGYLVPPKDAFGRYLILDENETEFGDTDCRWDSLWSAGPDGVWEGPGRGDDRGGDDIIYRLQPLSGGCEENPS